MYESIDTYDDRSPLISPWGEKRGDKEEKPRHPPDAPTDAT
jgi:hypothetical protein